MRLARVRTALLVGAAYVLIGYGTAVLAGTASSWAAVKGWRLAAWLLSLALFCLHFTVARARLGRRMSVAVEVALAVAIGAFGVAALGPLRAHWGEPSRLKLVALSIVAWPVLAGLPGFCVALIGGFILDRMGNRAHASPGRVA